MNYRGWFLGAIPFVFGLLLAACGPSQPALPTVPPSASATPPRVAPTQLVATPVSAAALLQPTPSTRTRVLDNGWTQYEKSGDGFSIALPPTWKQLDLEKEAVARVLGPLQARDPDVATAFEGWARGQVAAGIRFLALDVSPEAFAARYPTYLSISSSSTRTALSLDYVGQFNAAIIEALPNVVKPVVRQRVKTTDGEAEEVRFAIDQTVDGEKTIRMAAMQYYVVAGKRLFSILMATKQETAERYEDTFKEIGQSFRPLEDPTAVAQQATPATGPVVRTPSTPKPTPPPGATPAGLTGQVSTTVWPTVPIRIDTADRVEQLSVLGGYREYVGKLAFSPDGRQLAVGSRGVARLIELPAGRELLAFGDPGNGPIGVAFSPDGRLLALGFRNVIKLVEVPSGRELRSIENKEGWVTRPRFSSDGSLLMGKANGNAAKLWEVDTGREVLSVQGHGPSGPLTSLSDVAISPDGQLLATSSYDRTVKLWEVATGRQVRTLYGHGREISSVSFSPDGSVIASGARGELKLWDVASGRELLALHGHTQPVRDLSFSPDGSMLASAAEDWSARL